MPIISVNGNLDSTTPVGVSQLGTIVFDNVLFPSGSWVNDEGNTISYEQVKLDAVTLAVNRMKVIQKSRVSGRKGTRKEYITIDDYMITLEAIIAPETFSPLDLAQIGLGNIVPSTQFIAGNVGFTVPDEPSQLLNAIARLDDVQDSVEIRSKFLKNNYYITNVVIEEMNINKTTADTYLLRMRLASDDLMDLADFG